MGEFWAEVEGVGLPDLTSKLDIVRLLCVEFCAEVIGVGFADFIPVSKLDAGVLVLPCRVELFCPPIKVNRGL